MRSAATAAECGEIVDLNSLPGVVDVAQQDPVFEECTRGSTLPSVGLEVDGGVVELSDYQVPKRDERAFGEAGALRGSGSGVCGGRGCWACIWVSGGVADGGREGGGVFLIPPRHGVPCVDISRELEN